jgi:hypothetical protein
MKRLTKSQYEAIAEVLYRAYTDDRNHRDTVIALAYDLARNFRLSDKEFDLYKFIEQSLGTIETLNRIAK